MLPSLLILAVSFAHTQSSREVRCFKEPESHPGYKAGEWYWKDSGGCTRLKADIDRIVADHGLWLAYGGENSEGISLPGKRAILEGVDLTGADLRGAVLDEAVLQSSLLHDANLSSARLNRANLERSDLSGARLNHASLEEADLRLANLEGTDLSSASLNGADIRWTDFSNATLTNATLEDVTARRAIFAKAKLQNVRLKGTIQEADFHFAVLSSATIDNANLTATSFADCLLENAFLMRSTIDDARFDRAVLTALTLQDLQDLPNAGALSTALGLDRLKVSENLGILLDWRQHLKDRGFFRAGKQVNAAIWRNYAQAMQNPTWVHSLSFGFIDFACEYGANTLRPLLLLVGQWPLFTLIYLLHMQWNRGPGQGLHRITTSLTGTKRSRPVSPKPLPSAVRFALAHSALATFSVGFREFNLAPFLGKLLLPWDEEIEPRGWAAKWTAVQSALGMILLALAVLSFLGTPFEL